VWHFWDMADSRRAPALVATDPVPPPTDDDPIRDKLDKAKTAFDDAVEKYQKKVHDGLDKAEETAHKAGNKDRVDKIQAEREAFENSDDDLPKSVVLAKEYKRDEDAARAILDLAYEAAAVEYLKEKKDAKAEGVADDRKKFQEGHPTDAFKVGSVWKGKAVQVWIGHPEALRTDCSLTVLERDDKTFKATVEELGYTLEVHGTIVRGVIRWKAKDVKAIKGGPEYDTGGKLTGTGVDLRSEWIGGVNNIPTPTVLTVHLEKK
jgi:hypothetical protein